MRKKILFLILAFLILGAGMGQARIYMTQARVDGLDGQANVEQGATFRVTIKYENDQGRDVNIYGAKVWMRYDSSTTLVDDPQAVNRTAGLSIGSIIKAAGEIRYEYIAPSGSPVLVRNTTPRTIIDLMEITFHVKKTAATSPINIRWWEDPTGNVYVKEAGGVDVSGARDTPPSVTIVTGAAPTFTGLDGPSPVGVYNGDKAGTRPSIGNTASLDWSGNRNTADDTGTAKTFYGSSAPSPAGQSLRYHVYRGTTRLAEFLNQGTFMDGAGRGVPTTGLNDGTSYTYKANAVDNTDSGTNPNDQDNTTNHDPTPGVADTVGCNENSTSSFTITPTDTTSPGEVTGAGTGSGDGELTLSWANPGGYDDQGGVVIIMRPDAPVDAVSIRGANPSTYAHGDIMTEGDSPGNGTVIFAGKNDADPANHGNTGIQRNQGAPPGEVFSSFRKTGLDNGRTYHFKIITYDQINGTAGVDLVQMGRNYSSGVDVSGVPGVPPRALNEFIALTGPMVNNITFRWINSPDSFCTGVRVAYCDNDLPTDRWALLPTPAGDGTVTSWPTAPGFGAGTQTNDGYGFIDFPVSTFDPPFVPSTISTATWDAAAALGSMVPIYFFKAYPYNNSSKYGPSAQTAAVSSLGGFASNEAQFTLRKDDGGMGVNSIAFPFVTPFNLGRVAPTPSGTTDIADHILGFIQAINNQAGGNYVQALGWWDGGAKGVKKVNYGTSPALTPVRTLAGTDLTLTTGVAATDPIIAYRGYQVWVANPADAAAAVGPITLKATK